MITGIVASYRPSDDPPPSEPEFSDGGTGTVGSLGNWRSITYGQYIYLGSPVDYFAVVSDDGYAMDATASDMSWGDRTSSVPYTGLEMTESAYNSGASLFMVIVAPTSVHSDKVWTFGTMGGGSWTERTLPADFRAHSIIYSTFYGEFIINGGMYEDDIFTGEYKMYRTGDGTTFTEITSAGTGLISLLCDMGEGLFVGTSETADVNYILFDTFGDDEYPMIVDEITEACLGNGGTSVSNVVYNTGTNVGCMIVVGPGPDLRQYAVKFTFGVAEEPESPFIYTVSEIYGPMDIGVTPASFSLTTFGTYFAAVPQDGSTKPVIWTFGSLPAVAWLTGILLPNDDWRDVAYSPNTSKLVAVSHTSNSYAVANIVGA